MRFYPGQHVYVSELPLGSAWNRGIVLGLHCTDVDNDPSWTLWLVRVDNGSEFACTSRWIRAISPLQELAEVGE